MLSACSCPRTVTPAAAQEGSWVMLHGEPGTKKATIQRPRFPTGLPPSRPRPSVPRESSALRTVTATDNETSACLRGNSGFGRETNVILLCASFLSTGDRYWVFKDNNVEEGYPRPISDFGLPPGGIDAAFSWAHNDKTYFFKDNLYWRYDDHERRMDPGYPSETNPWKGIPSPLDDAMRWSDGESICWFKKTQEKKKNQCFICT